MSEQRTRYQPGPVRGETNQRKIPDNPESKTTKELEEVFQRLLVSTAMFVGARAGALALVSPTSKKLTPLVAHAVEGAPPLRPEHERIARWVITRKTSALLDQTAVDPRTQYPGIKITGSLMCVPLLAGQEALGALLLSNPRPGAFNHQHLKLLEMVTDLAAATILHARQQESALQQAQTLSTVVEVARALSNTIEMRQVLSLTTTGIRRLITCEEAVLFSYEAPTQELRGVAGLGKKSVRLAEQRIQVSDTQSVTAWVARERRPLLHSTGSRAFVGRVTDTLLTSDDLALLAVPLVAQERLWGVITLARPQPFDASDLRVMLNLSSFVAPALAQANRPKRES